MKTRASLTRKLTFLQGMEDVEEVDDTWYAVRYVNEYRVDTAQLHVLYSGEWAGIVQAGRASPNCPTLLCQLVSY
jgi:hypothetical protein